MPAFSCPICSEKLDKHPAEGQARGRIGTEINISATPCGHIFHTYCIQKWLTGDLASSKQCPCCREEVPGLRCNPLYPTIHDDDSILDDPAGPSNAVIPCNHGEIITSLKGQLTKAELEHKNLKQLHDLLSIDFESVSNRLINERNQTDVWMVRAKEYESYKDLAQQAQDRMYEAESKLKQFSKIHEMIQGFEDKVAEEIRDYPPTVESIKRLLEMKHIMTSKFEEAKKVNGSLRAEKMKLKMKLDKKNNEYKDLRHTYEKSRLNGRVRAESPVSTNPGASTDTPPTFCSSKRRIQEPIPSSSISGQGPGLHNNVDLFTLIQDKRCAKVINKMKAIKPTATISSLESNSPIKSTSSKSSSSKLKSRPTVPLSDNYEHSQKRSMFSELDPSQHNSESSGNCNETVLLSSDNDESDVLIPSDNEQDDCFMVRDSVPGDPDPLPVSSKRPKMMLNKAEKPVVTGPSKKVNFSKKKSSR